MTKELIANFGQYGVALAAVNVLVDQIGFPVPAYPSLIVAGAVAADGRPPLHGGLDAWVAAGHAVEMPP